MFYATCMLPLYNKEFCNSQYFYFTKYFPMKLTKKSLFIRKKGVFHLKIFKDSLKEYQLHLHFARLTLMNDNDFRFPQRILQKLHPFGPDWNKPPLLLHWRNTSVIRIVLMTREGRSPYDDTDGFLCCWYLKCVALCLKGAPTQVQNHASLIRNNQRTGRICEIKNWSSYVQGLTKIRF